MKEINWSGRAECVKNQIKSVKCEEFLMNVNEAKKNINRLYQRMLG